MIANVEYVETRVSITFLLKKKKVILGLKNTLKISFQNYINSILYLYKIYVSKNQHYLVIFKLQRLIKYYFKNLNQIFLNIRTKTKI